VANLVGMLAGLIPRDELNHPQWQFRVASTKRLQGAERKRPAGAFGGQEEDLVELLPRARLEHRKQRGDSLADARGCLSQQAASEAGRVEHRLCKLALSSTKLLMRKAEPGECCIAERPMREFEFCPLDKALAQCLEERVQVRRSAMLTQRWRLLLLVDVEVHQRHCQCRQSELPARHRSVDLRLRPVQMAMVGRHEVEVALEGLDLFKHLPLRFEIVGAPAHHQVLVLGTQRYLGAMGRRTTRRHRLVPGDALLRSWRRGEAQVQVALLGGELA